MTKLLVKAILQQALHYEWSLQGLGMLRLYLSENVRLHVWHKAFMAPGVSTIHTHPWDFTSHVVAGAVTNTRFAVTATIPGSAFRSQLLHCGPGGHLIGESHPLGLLPSAVDVYEEGAVYQQTADEIHCSDPVDGTVTLVTRTFTDHNKDHAFVYWPEGEAWVAAEPRPATPAEITAITQFALARWFA